MLSKLGALVLRRGLNQAPQARSLGASIPVILLEDMDQGREGEIVRVKRGFMRNYLMPRKKACYLTNENKEKHASKLEKAKAYKNLATDSMHPALPRRKLRRTLWIDLSR